VWESGSHGYDVVDYQRVDRRLGDRKALLRLVEEVHTRGMRLVLDGVFNHVGREFGAFKDVREKGPQSAYVNWFHLDFKGTSPWHDPFSYQTWNGCYDLVKLNLGNPEVRGHLLQALASWIREYDIDGLRLDAADHLELGFIRELAHCCRGLKPDFWLMGEVVKGPYTPWLEEAGLDSVTNYECYKGLYSSLNDANYHEIAYTLRRHFGEEGLYREKSLCSFVDNHDVTRAASRLGNPVHLYPLYCLLFTIPGTPAIYYGSEFGIEGVKSRKDDWPLRPRLELDELLAAPPHADLVRAVTRLAHLRRELPALCRGNFQQHFLSHRRLVFSRRTSEQWVMVAVSAEPKPIDQKVTLSEPISGRLVDLLNPGQQFEIKDGEAVLSPLWPCWARVMKVETTG
jgi:glycosidase